MIAAPQIPVDDLVTYSMVEYALRYAEQGWAVIPLHTIDDDGRCSCGRECGRDAGKHPIANLVPNGLKDATVDVRTIIEWWAGFPDANIGIVTGAVSGVVVIDADGADGVATFTDMVQENGKFEQPLMAQTGGGGIHFWFRHPGGKVKNSTSKLGYKLDVRGDGGYAVVAPSLHRSGNRYRWEEGPNGLTRMPEWLIEALAKAGRRDDINSKLAEPGAKIESGYRNDTLASLAGSMRQRGMIANEIYAALIEVNKRCVPPLEPHDVRKIADSIASYPVTEYRRPVESWRRDGRR